IARFLCREIPLRSRHSNCAGLCGRESPYLLRLSFGVGDLTLPVFAVLLYLFQRSKRLLQIGADSGVDPPHEFFFSHRTRPFRKFGASRSSVGGTHGYHPLPH
ncbi:MAG: hypothetical protein OEU09_18145, partial [Rhodospirillales bacterium]|nr:hypothetical protein [Rhodospirillales bacterium]